MQKNKNSKVKSHILIYLGTVLIFSSLVFILYQQNRIADEKRNAIELEKQLEQISSNKEDKNTYAFPKIQADEIQSSAIGVLRVDKLKIVLPIFEDASNESLLEGVGVVQKTDLPSSKLNTITVLAGHRGGRNENQTFINIDELENGDEIKITTKTDVLQYKVVGQEIIQPTDWSRFIRETDKTKLFLMSCHPYPQNYQRLLVKAELVRN